MQNNRLILLLQSFDRREMSRFREFACSPYFNKHEGVQQLVSHLSDIYPHFDERHCHREVLFRQLFPGEKHEQQKLALLFTYSMRLAEQFLTIEQFCRAEEFRDHLLLRQLRAKKQYRGYERARKKTEQQFQDSASRGGDWYYRQYLLAAEADEYFSTSSERRTDDSLQQKQHFLGRFFLAEKLRDACEMQVRSHILKVQYNDPLFPLVLQAVESHFETLRLEPAIAMYYWLYQMISRPADTGFYFEALSALEEHQALLPVPELKAIYNYLQNYCIQKINEGEGSFLQEIFKLYQAQLEQGLLLEDGYLSEWHYKNIVTTGIRLQEMNWVYRFIEGHKGQLPEEARDNAYRFNLASYYYAAEQYGEVLRLLIQVEYSDLRYNLGAKALLLRTYYDLDEYEALKSLTESFKQYLHRNKLMADVKRQGYYNLFKLTRRAARLRSNLEYYSSERSHRELSKLQEAIGRAGAIFNKGWLLEKVAALKKEIETPA